MANKIQLRRGLKASMPTGSAGEPLYATDTREFYIGTGSGNVNMGGSHWYRGTAMSGTSSTTGAYSYSACPEVKVDDIYLNTSNGNVYACTTAGSGTSAKWTYQGSIKGATGSNATVTVDSAMSATSTNPVQNKVVKAEIDKKTSTLAFWDSVDIENGNFYVGDEWIEECVGKLVYMSAAYDWYDTIATFPGSSTQNSWNLYSFSGGNGTSVSQGEAALIYFKNSTTAYVLMKG